MLRSCFQSVYTSAINHIQFNRAFSDYLRLCVYTSGVFSAGDVGTCGWGQPQVRNRAGLQWAQLEQLRRRRVSRERCLALFPSRPCVPLTVGRRLRRALSFLRSANRHRTRLVCPWYAGPATSVAASIARGWTPAQQREDRFEARRRRSQLRQVAAQLRQEQLVGRRVRPLPMGKRGTGHTAVAGCPIEAGRSATDPRPSGPSVGEGGAAPASDRARNDLQMQAEGRGEGPVLGLADANRGFFVRGASRIGLEALSPNRKDDQPAVAKALLFHCDRC